MAQQSSPAREWHSARVTTLSAVLPAVYGGPRRGMPRATQSAWSWWGNLAWEGKGAYKSTCCFECFSWN